jgi:hypothetical protein
MTQTTKVSLTLDTAAAIANWMREDLDYAAEQASDKRIEAYLLRKDSLSFLAQGLKSEADALMILAQKCDQRADMHDQHFKQLEVVCIELTRAGV